MATPDEVRQYLAHWFQLGKHLCLRNGQERLLPDPVIQGDRYSEAFEECWRRVTAPDAGDCYLEGTEQTVQQLLAATWELLPCARCTMPVPVYSRGVTSAPCPCNDLRGWPNLELPLPRSPVSSQDCLRDICRRLEATNPLESSVETPGSEPIAPNGQAESLGQAGCLPHKSDKRPALESSLTVPQPPDLLPAPGLSSPPGPREESSARSVDGMLFGFTMNPQIMQLGPIPEKRPEPADG